MPSPILLNTNCGLREIAQSRCALCRGTVYVAESVQCLGKIWHKDCFKCQVCRRKLTLGSYEEYNQLPYCRAHYPKAAPILVPDSPEQLRLRRNTEMQSPNRYRYVYDKEIRGTKFSVTDDPVTVQAKNANRYSSNVHYKDQSQRNYCQHCNNSGSTNSNKVKHFGQLDDRYCNKSGSLKMPFVSKPAYNGCCQSMTIADPYDNCVSRYPKDSDPRYGNQQYKNANYDQRCCDTCTKSVMTGRNNFTGTGSCQVNSRGVNPCPRNVSKEDFSDGCAYQNCETQVSAYGNCQQTGMYKGEGQAGGLCTGNCNCQSTNFARAPVCPHTTNASRFRNNAWRDDGVRDFCTSGKSYDTTFNPQAYSGRCGANFEHQCGSKF